MKYRCKVCGEIIEQNTLCPFCGSGSDQIEVFEDDSEESNEKTYVCMNCGYETTNELYCDNCGSTNLMDSEVAKNIEVTVNDEENNVDSVEDFASNEDNEEENEEFSEDNANSDDTVEESELNEDMYEEEAEDYEKNYEEAKDEKESSENFDESEDETEETYENDEVTEEEPESFEESKEEQDESFGEEFEEPVEEVSEEVNEELEEASEETDLFEDFPVEETEEKLEEKSVEKKAENIKNPSNLNYLLKIYGYLYRKDYDLAEKFKKYLDRYILDEAIELSDNFELNVEECDDEFIKDILKQFIK